MRDLVRKPEDRFSHNEALLSKQNKSRVISFLGLWILHVKFDINQLAEMLFDNIDRQGGMPAYEPRCEKTGLRGFLTRSEKPGCAVTEDG